MNRCIGCGDELKKDDLFYIHVGNKTLAYQIYKIEIVKKEEAPDPHFAYSCVAWFSCNMGNHRKMWSYRCLFLQLPDKDRKVLSGDDKK